ncbi:MAG: hypothetical protein U0T07_09040 [Chitinophagales bacterium]
MLYFTTYFDKNYLSRGLAMYHSLKENTDGFQLYVLCLDDETAAYFLDNNSIYPEVVTLTTADIELQDTKLALSKTNRSKVEYYFTLSPCLPLYLLKKFQLPHICSLDADILFLSSPTPIFDALKNYSVIITPHKFSREITELELYGKFNVSFQIFKNDETGIACLEHWRTKCLEWCGDVYDEKQDRFADQKYLDNWETLFPNKVKSLNDNVSGIAPWNLNNYQLTSKDGKFYSYGKPIIFYHFHHFKLLQTHVASNGFYFYKAKPNKVLNKLYLNYWNQLIAIEIKLGFKKEKDIIRRTHLSGNQNLIIKLNDEGSAFLKFGKSIIIFADFQKLSGRFLKFICRIYA